MKTILAIYCICVLCGLLFSIITGQLDKDKEHKNPFNSLRDIISLPIIFIPVVNIIFVWFMWLFLWNGLKLFWYNFGWYIVLRFTVSAKNALIKFWIVKKLFPKHVKNFQQLNKVRELIFTDLLPPILNILFNEKHQSEQTSDQNPDGDDKRTPATGPGDNTAAGI